MSNSTQEVPKGLTACLSKAGLARGTTNTELATAAPNGAGIDFVINGIAYNMLDDASTASIPGALTTQAALTQCLYLFQVNAGGTMLVTKGEEKLTTRLYATGTLAQEALEWPAPTATYCPVGGYRIALAGAATYTAGTTNLNATNVTATFYDFGMGMPDRGISS